MIQLNWYKIFGESHQIPDGRTVTPTDDIQIWLHCADIWDKTYTTLVEVLADTSTLVMLMAIDNAVDYLVRSTTWVSGICSSEIAMKSIGASDYASTTLLADSTWNSAIHGSPYSSYVENVSVPIMTSNTTPSGTCSGSTVHSATYDYWKAFDGSADSNWSSSNGNTTNQYLRYVFDYSVTIYKAVVQNRNDSNNFYVKNCKIQYSADGITYLDDVSFTNSSGQAVSTTVMLSGVSGVGFGVFAIDNYGGNYSQIGELQFYGREIGGVQTWLRSANITDKTYTTLSEVLADSTTLSALMSNHNAVDYLVTAKGWADDICADSTAMTYIGLNNYASNTLLGDSTWCNAIWNSTYKMSVINAYVPVMTGYTTPSGEVIESGHRTDFNDTAGWYAFGNQPSSRGWFSQNSGSTDTYLGYVFDDDVRLVAVVISPHTGSNTTSYLYDTGYIQGSNDNFSTFDNIDSISAGSYTDLTVVTPNNYKHKAIRVFASRLSNYTVIRQMQFYGRKDV